MGDRRTGTEKDMISDEAGGELRAQNLFKIFFLKSRKDRNRTIVTRSFRVAGLVDGCNNGDLPCVRKAGGGDGKVDQVKDKRTDCREAAPDDSDRDAVNPEVQL